VCLCYTHIHSHTHTHTYIHTHIHTLMHTFTHIHTYTHTFTHTYIHTYICTYIHTHIHTYIHMYIHIHKHAHTLRFVYRLGLFISSIYSKEFDWQNRHDLTCVPLCTSLQQYFISIILWSNFGNLKYVKFGFETKLKSFGRYQKHWFNNYFSIYRYIAGNNLSI